MEFLITILLKVIDLSEMIQRIPPLSNMSIIYESSKLNSSLRSVNL